jgi:methylmalonyl-CoA/ethylmalonyl-CoA epimerase
MIIKMSHVGIVVNDIEESTKLWSDTYGLKVLKSGRVDAEGIKNRFFMIGNFFIELVEPIDKTDMKNAIARRLANKGEGVYHFAIVVDDLEKTYANLMEKGISMMKRDPIADEPDGRIVIHPKDASGILLELVTKGV